MPRGMSAFDRAVMRELVNVTGVIVERGADADATTADGSPPLHRVAHAREGQVEIARLLLDHGADVNAADTDGSTSLCIATFAREGYVEMARVLLVHGADANNVFGDGSTPLHGAVAHDKPGIVSLLLLNGADADVLNNRGVTPLQVAAALGRVAAARALLVGGADAAIRHGGSQSALDIAAKGGYVDVMRAIIEHGVDVNGASSGGTTALHRASGANKTAAMEFLIEAGADIEAPVHGNRNTPLFVAAVESNVSAVVVLLKHGAFVIHRNAAQHPPLHYAAAKAGILGTAEVVDLLLRHGADEKAIGTDGRTPTDMVGARVDEHHNVAADVGRVRQLLANAPADRAWRRRCFLVLCRAHSQRQGAAGTRERQRI